MHLIHHPINWVLRGVTETIVGKLLRLGLGISIFFPTSFGGHTIRNTKKLTGKKFLKLLSSKLEL